MGVGNLDDFTIHLKLFILRFLNQNLDVAAQKLLLCVVKIWIQFLLK